MAEQKETASVSFSKGVLIALVSLAGGGVATGAVLGSTHTPAPVVAAQPDALARIEAKIDATAKATADLRAEVAEIRGELKARP
jgi:hypothetical protein